MSTQDPFGHEDVREGDLLAYLDGAASPALAAHVASCPHCRAELAGLLQAETVLVAAFDRAACPAPELLLRFQAGLLAVDEAARVADHAAACADCAAELALLTAPPEPSLPGRLARAGVRLVRALLQPAAPPALALRGAALEARRAVFAGEGYQVLVVVTPVRAAGGPYEVEGQLVGPAGALSGTARLSGSAQAEREAEVDALGFFAFDAVPPGAYTVSLIAGDVEVLTEILEVP